MIAILAILALSFGTIGSLADSPSVAQQVAAGVANPLDLSNVGPEYFLQAQNVTKRGDPSAPIPGGLKQVTRAQLLARVQRGNKGLAKRLSSTKPATCVSDSEPSKNGVKAAVFTDIATSDNGQVLGTEAESTIGGCAQFCESFPTCTFGYIYDGTCTAKDATVLTGIATFSGDDEFAFLDRDCASVKKDIPGAAQQDCCNLYY